MRTQRRKGNNLKKGVALFLVLLLAFAGSLVTFGQVGCAELILNRNDLVPLGSEYSFSVAGGTIWVQIDQNTVGQGQNEMISFRIEGDIEVTSGPNYTRQGGSGQIHQVSFTICPIVPEPIIYTVTFDGNGGTPATQTEDVEEGETVGTLPTVSQEGYTFVEWNTNMNGEGDEFTGDTEVSGDITVYAIWSEDQVTRYTVTYNDNGADSGTVPVDDNSPYASGQTVTVLGNPGNIYKEGFVFVGWKYRDYYGIGSDRTFLEGQEFTMPAENVILYATGRPVETFTVTFNGNGGTPPSQTEAVEDGETVETLPTVSWEGYTFMGWNTDMNGEGDAFTTSTIVTDDITVYAQWQPVQNGGGGPEEPDMVTVTFIGNGGTPAEQTKVVEAGEMVGSLLSASRPGHTFLRWDTESDGTGDTFTATTAVEGDITVYAIWRAVPSGGGSSSPSRTPATPRENVPEIVEEILEVVVEPEIPSATPPVFEAPVLDEVPLAAPPVLPQTGDASPLAMILSGLGASLSGLAMKFRKKGKDDSVTTLFK